MTVLSEVSDVTYSGNGGTTTFDVPFRFLAAADLKIIITDATGLTATPAFSATGVGDQSGGAITLAAAPPSGSRVYIYRDPITTQTASFVDHAKFPAKSVEDVLDKGRMIEMETRRRLNRSLRLRDSDANGAGAYDAMGNRITSLGAPVIGTDAARAVDIQNIVAAAGNVPGPLSGQAGSFLVADSAGVFSWHAPAVKIHPRTLADVCAKLFAGGTAKIAFEGDSLTYGQDLTTETGNQSGINGASNGRSVTPMPESLLFAVETFLPTGLLTVVNRGYPGDKTSDALTRWGGTQDHMDFVFLMYGTNDSNLTGGLINISIDQYRANMVQLIERRLQDGSGVGILLPPMIEDLTWDNRLRGYATVAKHLAMEYGLLCFDMAQALAGRVQISEFMWTDGLHLTAANYNEMAFQLAALVAAGGEVLAKVGPGTILNAQDRIGFAKSKIFTFSATNGQAVIVPADAGSVVLAVDVATPCWPVVTMVNTSPGTQRSVICYHSGPQSRSGDAPVTVYSDGRTSAEQRTMVQKLQPGYRFLVFQNINPDDGYIARVEFVSQGHVQTFRGLFKASALAGMRCPAFLSGVDAGWAAADYDCFMQPGYVVDLTVKWDGLNVSGFSLMADMEQGSIVLSNNQLIVMRSGTSLVVRKIVNGVATDVATYAAVFTNTMDYIGDVLLGNDGANLTIVVNGASHVIANQGFSSGYLGMIAYAGCSTAILAAAVLPRSL